MMTYRDDSFAADVQYDELLEKRLEELPAALELESVHERRAGRMAAGAAGICGALVMAAAALDLALPRPQFGDGVLVKILLGSWGAMGIGYVLGRVWSRLQHERPAIPMRSRDRWADAAKLEASLVSGSDIDRVDRLERASVALPLMAIALLAPLTIHSAVYAVALAANDCLREFRQFDKWIAVSLVIVGHAHLVAVYGCHRFAKKLKALPSVLIEKEGKSLGWSALWWAAVASAVPGAVLYLIPPLIALATGLLFMPAMFYFMRRRLIAERGVLAASASLGVAC